jgi:oligopeptide/dipeptide ABC transporter ATP-binding protein
MEIAGMVPSLKDMPPGCTFAARCGFASEVCRKAYPPLEEKAPGHVAACWNAHLLPGAAHG